MSEVIKDKDTMETTESTKAETETKLSDGYPIDDDSLDEVAGGIRLPVSR